MKLLYSPPDVEVVKFKVKMPLLASSVENNNSESFSAEEEGEW